MARASSPAGTTPMRTTGRPSSRSRRAASSPASSPISITPASRSSGASSPFRWTTGSWPSRRTTRSSSVRRSACGSTMRIRATSSQHSLDLWRNTVPSGYENSVSAAGVGAARILVVDDDPDTRSLLRDVLVRAGYQVDEASDGRAALRRLFESAPALVVLDVAMPGLDGYATLERIRDLSDVPVLMLTARAEELERVRGLTAGADDY